MVTVVACVTVPVSLQQVAPPPTQPTAAADITEAGPFSLFLFFHLVLFASVPVETFRFCSEHEDDGVHSAGRLCYQHSTSAQRQRNKRATVHNLLHNWSRVFILFFESELFLFAAQVTGVRGSLTVSYVQGVTQSHLSQVSSFCLLCRIFVLFDLSVSLAQRTTFGNWPVLQTLSTPRCRRSRSAQCA